MLNVSEESTFLEVISTIAQLEAIQQLDDEVFDFGEGAFTGQVWAIEPESNLKVQVNEFALTGEDLDLALMINGLFGLKGSLEQGGIKISVSSELVAKATTAGEIQVVFEAGEFYLDPYVEDLELEVDIQSLTPASLSGGKTLISRILNTAFDKRKSGILDQVNKTLGKYKLD